MDARGTAAVMVALLCGAGAAAAYLATRSKAVPASSPAAAVDRDAAAVAPAPTKKLALPGWEDLRFGQPASAEIRQRCFPVQGMGKSTEECQACRSAALPTPCVKVVLREGVISMVSASLPKDDAEADAVAQALRHAWGPAAAINRNNALDLECWETSGEYALLSTSYYDLSNANLKDPNLAVPRAQHPIRAVIVAGDSQSAMCRGVREAAASTPSAPRKPLRGGRECGGTSVLQLIIALRYPGTTTTPMPGVCLYDVPFASVVNTTSDGWTMVQFGEDLGAAFRTQRHYVDGALIRNRTATFLGLESFTLVNGANATLPAFQLDD